MSFMDNLKYRFATFSIAEKIILINVVCYLLPMMLNVLFFLFKVYYVMYCILFVHIEGIR